MTIASFIKFKIVIRSAISSIVPIILYSLGFPIFKLIVTSDTPYFNMWSWIIIACFTFLWPFQQISLWFIFTPVIYRIKNAVKKNKLTIVKNGIEEPLVPFCDRGNFAPVKHEIQYKVENIIYGKVPTDLNGSYVKNGPNQYIENTDIERSHWFGGDSMLHAFCLKDGVLLYCNRFTKTNKHISEKKTGQKQIALSDLTEFGVLLAPLNQFMTQIGYKKPLGDEFQKATASTAMIQHAQHTYALVEVDQPFEVAINKRLEEVDIESVGYDNFDGQLKHNCSAHPKVDRRTKELFVFAYSFSSGATHYSVFDNNRKLLRSYSIPLISPRMVHEYLITEKYAIIPDLPLEMDPPGAIKNKRSLFNYNKEGGARYGIFPRDSQDGKDVKWFDVEAHFAFHYAGTWDSVNDQGQQIVTVYAVTWPDIEIGLQYKEHWFKENEIQKFEKFEFNLTTMETRRTVLLEDMYMEFPNLNQEYYGYKSRYTYIAFRKRDETLSTDKIENDNYLYTGFFKYDMQDDKLVKEVSFGENCVGAEVYFEQRDGSDPLQNEDDGYIMTAVHNWKTNTSQFIMWDAKTLDIVVKANLKERVPYGFHATFIQEKDY